VIKFALPGGDIRDEAARLLTALGLHSGEYADGSRAYRFPLSSEETELRVFREKDIPIQIALGNYDLGICNRVWLDELQARYPQEQVVPLRSFGFGRTQVVAAVSPATLRSLGPIERWGEIEGLRIVAEFPYLAERFALASRFPRFQIIPVWGTAAAYPPEDAELAVFADPGEIMSRYGLMQVARLSAGSACLLTNRKCLADKDLRPILDPLFMAEQALDEAAPREIVRVHPPHGFPRQIQRRLNKELRLAVPDGHAQRHTYQALLAAGIEFDGYGEKESRPRPSSGIPGLAIKVIRPQDMPQQVALGNFDLAVTGRDWLRDHLIAFPSSPVREILDLQRSRYSLCAVVDQDLPAENLPEALAHWRTTGRSVIRIASEYSNLADQYARQRRIGRYQIIPVSGASEGFVPEDAEILLEGTETGTSVAANHLKIIDRIFESTNCLIGGANRPAGIAADIYDALLQKLQVSLSVSA
jgi:ATP phosphoribosyltransferase